MTWAWRRNILSIVVFLGSFCFLLVFINEFIGGTATNFVAFWIAVLGLIIPVFYLIFQPEHTTSTKAAILAEILLIVFLLNLVQIILRHYQLTVSGDGYLVLVSARRIEVAQGLLTSSVSSFDRFPLFQMFNLTVSQVTGIGLYDLALYSPMFYQMLGILFIYFFARAIYDSRTAFFATALFAPYNLLAEINSNFRPEIIAYIFLFACVTLVYKRGSSPSRVSLSLLVILFMVAITLSHYTTNVFFILFISTLFIIVMLGKTRPLRIIVNSSPSLNPGAAFLLVTIVFSAGYWIFVGTGLINLVSMTFRNLSTIGVTPLSSLGYTPRTALLKDIVVLRTGAFFVLLFSLLFLYQIVVRRKTWQVDLQLATWSAVSFALWLFLEYHPELLSPTRVLLFCYPFVLILVAHTILGFKERSTRAGLIVLMIAFVLFNILSISIIPLNPLENESPFSLADWDTAREISAAEWPGLTDGPALASGSMTSLLQYYQQTPAGEVSNLIDNFEVTEATWREGASITNKFAWFIVSTEDPAFVRRSGFLNVAIRLNEDSLNRLPETPWLQKVYTNGEWDTYRITRTGLDSSG